MRPVVLLLALALSAATAAAQGTIAGRVAAQGSNEPLADARVMVIGTSLMTTSGADGRYTLRNVPRGTANVRVLRVGFQEQKRAVVVENGQSATADFTLAQSIVQLSEVVTTATGEQRRVELGNAVTTLNVADMVQQAPIKNMGDLLAAKAPGVQVLPGNMTGGGSRVRIRGTASLSLSNDPIYIIDGIRMTSSSASAYVGVGGTTPSRVNDINPEEIENIEIVKGPSAATLYGTDAANGVIVITTKQGRSGAAQWHVFGDAGLIQDRNSYPRQYAIFGHTATSAATRCFLEDIARGVCTRDSTSEFSVLRQSDLTPIKDGNRSQLGAQVGGGTESLRYFVSGDAERETGPFSMPTFERRRFDSLGVKVREEWAHPNYLQKASARVNLNTAVSPKLDLAVQSGFVKLDQRLPQVDNNVNSFWFNAMTGPGYPGGRPGPGYTGVASGVPLHGYASFTPGDIFQRTTMQGVQRYIGSVNANWRPFTWMQNRADVGLDLTDRVEFRLCRFAECPNFGTQRLGDALDARTNIRNFTANFGSTASYQPAASLNFRTTAGAQYVNYKLDQAVAQGSQLPPGGQTPKSGTIPNVDAATDLSKTLGLFVEEQAGVRDRLFLTAAVRTDQNSAFGTNFQRVYYPKGAVSWVVSQEPFFPAMRWLTQLRLRASVGASGVQPGPNEAARTFAATTTNIANTDVSGLRSDRLGNANLRPERSTEAEGGFEARIFDRLNLDVTYYSKISRDALIDQVLAPSTGASVATMKANLGKVKNTGVEALINAQIVERRAFAWDVVFNLSHNTNKLVTLGKDVPPVIGTSVRQVPGYPVNGYWQRPFKYEDVNGDGLISRDEVFVKEGTIDTAAIFIGYSQPRAELSVQNSIELFNRKLRLNVLTDYKGGYSVLNSEKQFLCQQSAACRETSSLDATQWEQARAVAQRNKGTINTTAGYMEPVQFWRLREIAGTVTLSERNAQRFLRAKGANVNVGARNIALWRIATRTRAATLRNGSVIRVKYSGVDPEANYSQGDTQATLLTAGPPTYFTVRLNLTY